MHKLLQQIRDNKELLDLEEAGFRRGDEKGKTMDVPLAYLVYSLNKQHQDFEYAWSMYVIKHAAIGDKSLEGLKKATVDIINNADCFFLKLQEKQKKGEHEIISPYDEGHFPPQHSQT